MPTHCTVAYESVHSFARGHVIRMCIIEQEHKLTTVETRTARYNHLTSIK